MLARIKELANGDLQRPAPLLQFSVDKVELEVLEGKVAAGSFGLSVLNGRKARGVVYTTGRRMNCLTPQIEGTEVTIRYEYDSAGLSEGDIEKGSFTLVLNQCEYTLSFVATVERLRKQSPLDMSLKTTGR